jgi:hypothetical protein
MKALYLLAASAFALTAAACGPKVPAARAALECPTKQGELTRSSVSPDGKACTYTSAGGAEVTLQLVSVQGGVDSALSNIETNLMAARVKAAEAQKAAETAEAKPAEAAKDGKVAASAADQAAREAAADTKDIDVKVEVGKNGTVVTEGDGGVTRVDLPGIHIEADDEKDSARVQLGPIKIDAGDDTAQIRIRRDVRLRGEALNPEKRGVRATFIYTGKDLPEGYRYVGYEAGGPKRGPIAVAVVKSKSEHHDVDEVASDVRKLVRKNGGV